MVVRWLFKSFAGFDIFDLKKRCERNSDNGGNWFSDRMQMSNEKNLYCLGYIGDETGYVGIMISHYKDSY